jgi:hypothetical protein
VLQSSWELFQALTVGMPQTELPGEVPVLQSLCEVQTRRLDWAWRLVSYQSLPPPMRSTSDRPRDIDISPSPVPLLFGSILSNV